MPIEIVINRDFFKSQPSFQFEDLLWFAAEITHSTQAELPNIFFLDIKLQKQTVVV